MVNKQIDFFVNINIPLLHLLRILTSNGSFRIKKCNFLQQVGTNFYQIRHQN